MGHLCPARLTNGTLVPNKDTRRKEKTWGCHAMPKIKNTETNWKLFKRLKMNLTEIQIWIGNSNYETWDLLIGQLLYWCALWTYNSHYKSSVGIDLIAAKAARALGETSLVDPNKLKRHEWLSQRQWFRTELRKREQMFLCKTPYRKVGTIGSTWDVVVSLLRVRFHVNVWVDSW